jgi:hypothetical protein
MSDDYFITFIDINNQFCIDNIGKTLVCANIENNFQQSPGQLFKKLNNVIDPNLVAGHIPYILSNVLNISLDTTLYDLNLTDHAGLAVSF